ncbi:MAG: hypothetical protein QOK72_08095 [Nitrososphaeraceae archaeon]|nr:hypothetical protein [Nitrososphaeraceae archaeon]
MPLKLSTTIGKIQNIPNSKNIEIINEFLEYMKEVTIIQNIIKITI